MPLVAEHKPREERHDERETQAQDHSGGSSPHPRGPRVCGFKRTTQPSRDPSLLKPLHQSSCRPQLHLGCLN